ncbi:DUF4920 domain-containing protein [Gillisia sp. M10.2A]|uniref:DUF4920 domain-containing protein n=1 Tax=Gillisia lutea TaxID=2909668 RepID=A0ABS9EJT5_9FLAO|nr:DUF4920 domain-containing protein [Gillisia lutea]MCF4102075.1 DUF4920 domain-containing protein [Gillisia lutea]
MKYLLILSLLLTVSLTSCKDKETKEEPQAEMAEEMYDSYGENISSATSLSAIEMEEKYQNLKAGDTVEVSFKTDVTSVCKSKGCWMTLELPGEEDVMVKFRDYGFFVPKDIEEKEAVVRGKAYVTEVSVEEQQHYAEDKGKTEEEIAAIVSPKRTLSFLADGVLIKK